MHMYKNSPNAIKVRTPQDYWSSLWLMGDYCIAVAVYIMENLSFMCFRLGGRLYMLHTFEAFSDQCFALKLP